MYVYGNIYTVYIYIFVIAIITIYYIYNIAIIYDIW